MRSQKSLSNISGIVVKNLVHTFDDADETELKHGYDWYRIANSACQTIADKHSMSVRAVVGIVAALSPGLEWTRNLAQADAFITSNGEGVYGVYGRKNTIKARRILAGQDPDVVLSGPKVRAFFACIIDPTTDAVVIDSHAWCAGLNRTHGRWSNVRVTDTRYRWMARHYKHAAKRVSVSPAAFQAVVWITWKRQMENTK
jgi:hypothetical protein